jgi:hypothetical protein
MPLILPLDKNEILKGSHFAGEIIIPNKFLVSIISEKESFSNFSNFHLKNSVQYLILTIIFPQFIQTFEFSPSEPENSTSEPEN